jgi:C-terminal peptidase prc
MKKTTLISGVLGTLRSYATTLILASSLLATGIAHSAPTNSTAPAAAPAAVTTSATKPVDVKFDGAPVYRAAFEALRDNHKDLQDPVKRAKFVADWEKRHDNDAVFTSERGTDKAIYEMMWSLGQRFDYYNPPAAAQEERDQTQASMAGIGATLLQKNLSKAIRALGKEPKQEDVVPLFNLADERPMIVAEDPESNTPAGKGGLKKGDRIVAVDGAPVNGKTLDAVVGTIRGTPGTSVTLSIIRSSDVADIKLDIKLVREKFIVHAVKAHDIGGGVTLIKFDHFMSQYGTEEMFNALTEAAKGKAIILDLRGNPGGELGQAINISAMFLDSGPIVQLIQRNDDDMVTITHSVSPTKYTGRVQVTGGSDSTRIGKRLDRIVPKNMPIVVLVDGGSASASEILSGTLQANGRALIIGQPTVGKGVGQTVIPLPGGRNMHVTSFEFRPASLKMDWIGIVPDIEVVQPEDANPMEDPSTDAQLNRAKLEIIAALAGKPAPARPASEIATRKAELQKTKEDNFAKQLEARRKAIAEPLVDPAAAVEKADEAETKK